MVGDFTVVTIKKLDIPSVYIFTHTHASIIFGGKDVRMNVNTLSFKINRYIHTYRVSRYYVHLFSRRSLHHIIIVFLHTGIEVWRCAYKHAAANKKKKNIAHNVNDFYYMDTESTPICINRYSAAVRYPMHLGNVYMSALRNESFFLS